MNKRIINKLAAAFGFELNRHIPRDSHAARLSRILHHHDIDLVLDVGANAGDYALHLRDCGYRGRILSFEPLSDAHQALLHESAHDPLWDVAERTAIGDVDGTIEINVSHNSYSSSILEVDKKILQVAPDTAPVRKENVPLARLDTLFPASSGVLGSSTYLKVDVQGYEKQVLEGASGILPKVKGIQLELSLVQNYQGQSLYLEMMPYVISLGYELLAVIPGFTDATSGRLLQMDGIFFRPD